MGNVLSETLNLGEQLNGLDALTRLHQNAFKPYSESWANLVRVLCLHRTDTEQCW